MKISLGEKIKNFRKRAGMSQLDLEVQIVASPGSISRIENGQINPTKETLQKIITVLDLKISEAADLFDLNLEELPKLIRLAKKINSSLKMDEMLDIAVNDMMTDLKLSGVLIFLIEGDYLYAVAIDDAPPGREAFLKLLGLTKFRLRISLKEETQNYCVKCIKDNKPYLSYEAYDFTIDVLGRRITNMLSKSSNFKSGIVIPMATDKKIIGAVLYTKSIVDDFGQELPIFEAFNEYLATAILNIKEYEKIKAKLSKITKVK